MIYLGKEVLFLELVINAVLHGQLPSIVINKVQSWH